MHVRRHTAHSHTHDSSTRSSGSYMLRHCRRWCPRVPLGLQHPAAAAPVPEPLPSIWQTLVSASSQAASGPVGLTPPIEPGPEDCCQVGGDSIRAVTGGARLSGSSNCSNRKAIPSYLTVVSSTTALYLSGSSWAHGRNLTPHSCDQKPCIPAPCCCRAAAPDVCGTYTRTSCKHTKKPQEQQHYAQQQ
jgi:hypothetical protein